MESIENSYKEELKRLEERIRNIKNEIRNRKLRKIEEYESELRRIFIKLSYDVFNYVKKDRIFLYKGPLSKR